MIKLGPNMLECEVPWKHFVGFTRSRYSAEYWDENSLEILNKELMKLHSICDFYIGSTEIHFETPAHELFFRLKFANAIPVTENNYV
jgi:hypothetical protein